MRHHQIDGAPAPGLAAPQRAPVPADGLALLGAAGAAAAGLTAGHKDEARELGSAAGFREHTEPNSRDSAHHAPKTQPCGVTGKLFATLQARAVLFGHVLQQVVDDHSKPFFVVSRWGMSRQLSSVAEVEAFLLRVGGSSGA